MPPPATHWAPEAGPTPPPMSLAARLVNMFAAPGEVYDWVRTARVSSANWLVPALLLVLVSWAGTWLVLSQSAIQQQLSDITSRTIEQQVEKGQIRKEEADPVRAAAEKWGASPRQWAWWRGRCCWRLSRRFGGD